jgi:hypothetical protein
MRREATAQLLRKKEARILKRKNERMANLWDDLSEAVLGTSLQIATANLNAMEQVERQAPVGNTEASHRNVVVKSLKIASEMEEITDIKLKQR